MKTEKLKSFFRVKVYTRSSYQNKMLPLSRLNMCEQVFFDTFEEAEKWVKEERGSQ